MKKLHGATAGALVVLSACSLHPQASTTAVNVAPAATRHVLDARGAWGGRTSHGPGWQGHPGGAYAGGGSSHPGPAYLDGSWLSPLVPSQLADVNADSTRYAYDPTTGGNLTFAIGRAVDGDLDTQWASADPNTAQASQASQSGIAWYGFDFGSARAFVDLRIKCQPMVMGSYYEARVTNDLRYAPVSRDPRMASMTNTDFQLEDKPLSGTGRYLLLVWHRNATCSADAYGNVAGNYRAGGDAYFGIFDAQVYAD